MFNIKFRHIFLGGLSGVLCGIVAGILTGWSLPAAVLSSFIGTVGGTLGSALGEWLATPRSNKNPPNETPQTGIPVAVIQYQKLLDEKQKNAPIVNNTSENSAVTTETNDDNSRTQKLLK